MQFPAEQPRWGIMDVLIILLIILGTSFMFSWINPFVYYTLVYNYGLPDAVTTEFMLDFIVQFLVTLGVVALVVVWYRRAPLTEIGFNRIAARGLAAYGLGGGIILFMAVMAVGAVIQHLVPVPPQDFENVLRDASQGWEVVTLIIIGSVLAPFYEEIFFRGIIYPVCRKHLGIWGGIALSALIFSLVHMDAIRILPLFIGGAGLAYLYEKSGSIYVAWAAHGTWNLIMALSLYVNT